VPEAPPATGETTPQLLLEEHRRPVHRGLVVAAGAAPDRVVPGVLRILAARLLVAELAADLSPGVEVLLLEPDLGRTLAAGTGAAGPGAVPAALLAKAARVLDFHQRLHFGEGPLACTTVPYPVTSGDAQPRGYVRDALALEQDGAGRLGVWSCTCGPLAHAAGARALAGHLGVGWRARDVFFEGGNFLADGGRLFTLADTRRGNARWRPGTGMALLEQEVARCGGELIVLDDGWAGDRQPLFHLDLALGFVQDGQGRTVALLSSPRLARELLGPLGRDLDRELDPAALEELTPPELRRIPVEQEIARRHADALTDRLGLLSELARVVGAAAAREKLGRKLNTLLGPTAALEEQLRRRREYFRPESLSVLQRYLDGIGEGLAARGYRVIELPALLARTDLGPPAARSRLPRETPAGSGEGRAPLYCPANGLAVHGPGVRQYRAGAGLLPFDRHVRDALAGLGLDHRPSARAATFGSNYAGLHCLAQVW
jgi:hypothetical protein